MGQPLIIKYLSKGVSKPMKNKTGIIINSLLSILLIISVVFNINTYSKIKDSQSKQAELQSNVAELQEKIESETEKKDNLNIEISTLQSELENLQSEKAELQTKKEEMQSELESLNAVEEQPVEQIAETVDKIEQSAVEEEPATNEGNLTQENVGTILDSLFGEGTAATGGPTHTAWWQ
jgi:uncharacterized protein YlxW (UPF0749 family)